MLNKKVPNQTTVFNKSIALLCLSFLSGGVSYASLPQWWVDNSITNTAQDQSERLSAATVAQLKYIATAARTHIDASLDGLITQLEWDTAYAPYPDPFPLSQGVDSNSLATVGQAKFLLDGLYKLMLANSVDTNFLLRVNNAAWTENKPWADTDAGLENAQPITIAQLKFAFSFEVIIEDTDDDSLSDAWELRYFPDLSAEPYADPDNDGLNNLQEYLLGSSPINADTDGDNLSDFEEYQYGTNPRKADSDSDGLSDDEEVRTYSSNPNLIDTDHDGLSDYNEINVYLTDPLNRDTDGDGMPDGWEVSMGLRPTVDDAALNPDGDSANNLAEYQRGTHPRIADDPTLEPGVGLEVYTDLER